jgi:hypothetical protein
MLSEGRWSCKILLALEVPSLSSPEVRALWEEPTEAIPQNQREEAEGILSLHGPSGKGGCEFSFPLL